MHRRDRPSRHQPQGTVSSRTGDAGATKAGRLHARTQRRGLSTRVRRRLAPHPRMLDEQSETRGAHRSFWPVGRPAAEEGAEFFSGGLFVRCRRPGWVAQRVLGAASPWRQLRTEAASTLQRAASQASSTPASSMAQLRTELEIGTARPRAIADSAEAACQGRRTDPRRAAPVVILVVIVLHRGGEPRHTKRARRDSNPQPSHP